MKKQYIDYDFSKGWPVKHGLYYECLICKTVIPSDIKTHACCRCKNFSFDSDYGRMGANDESQIRLFKYTKTSFIKRIINWKLLK